VTGAAFTLEELEALVKRAVVLSLTMETASPVLSRAYQALADQADVLHALELRERKLVRPGMPDAVKSSGTQDDIFFDGEEGDPAPPPPLSNRERLLEGKPFIVRPKAASRCPACGEPQRRTESGMVCRNGHGY
jgi:hypothetical protein